MRAGNEEVVFKVLFSIPDSPFPIPPDQEDGNWETALPRFLDPWNQHSDPEDHRAKPMIEITESAFTVDIAIIRKGLSDLSSLGVKLAIDDFGGGFSSINHLRQFPIDRLKIDRSFTRAMLEGGRETELIQIILQL